MAVTASKAIRKRVEVTLAKAGVEPYDGTQVLAYINHDRWVADCACNGAELVAPGEEMLCGGCGARNTVKFPHPATRKKIEGLLGRREGLHRNWRPDETVAELAAQNIEHGLWEDM